MIKLNKKLYSMIVALLLVVIMVVTLVASFMPMFTVKASAARDYETFKTGRYTADMAPNDLDYGVIDGVKILGNLKYITHIIAVQSNDRNVAYYEKSILETLAKNPTADVSGTRKIISDYNADTDAREKALFVDEKGEEEFYKLLQDENLIDQVATVYSFIGVFDDGSFEASGLSSDYNTFFTIGVICGVMMFVGVLVIALVFAVACVITAIVKGIYAAAKVKNADEKVINRLFPHKLGGVAATLLVFTSLAIVFCGPYALTYGSGLVTLVILSIVASLIKGINHVMFEKNGTVAALAKVGIALLCIIFLLITLTSFFNIGTYEKAIDNGFDFASSEYYTKRYEVHAEQYKAEHPEPKAENYQSVSEFLGASTKYANDLGDYARSNASADKLSAYKGGIAPVMIYELIAVLVISITFVSAIDILGRKVYINKKTGQATESKVSVKTVVMVVIIIVAMILPAVMFTAPDYEALKSGYLEGEIKVQFNASKEETSPAGVSVKALETAIQLGEKSIEELDKAIDGATNDDIKASLVIEKGSAERQLAMYEYKLDYLTTSETGAIAVGVIMSVFTAALYIAYMIVPGILDKKFAKVVVAFDGDDDATAPTEDAPAEDAPAEDAPAEETSTDEQ